MSSGDLTASKSDELNKHFADKKFYNCSNFTEKFENLQ